MDLRTIAALLECEVVIGEGDLDRRIGSCFAADLMSDVLRFSAANALLVTGLTSIQSVHTADVADCRAILLVSAKRPVRQALETAQAKGIPILSTKRTMFEACGLLFQAGIRPSGKA